MGLDFKTSDGISSENGVGGAPLFGFKGTFLFANGVLVPALHSNVISAVSVKSGPKSSQTIIGGSGW